MIFPQIDYTLNDIKILIKLLKVEEETFHSFIFMISETIKNHDCREKFENFQICVRTYDRSSQSCYSCCSFNYR